MVAASSLSEALTHSVSGTPPLLATQSDAVQISILLGGPRTYEQPFLTCISVSSHILAFLKGQGFRKGKEVSKSERYRLTVPKFSDSNQCEAELDGPFTFIFFCNKLKNNFEIFKKWDILHKYENRQLLLANQKTLQYWACIHLWQKFARDEYGLF